MAWAASVTARIGREDGPEQIPPDAGRRAAASDAPGRAERRRAPTGRSRGASSRACSMFSWLRRRISPDTSLISRNRPSSPGSPARPKYAVCPLGDPRGSAKNAWPRVRGSRPSAPAAGRPARPRRVDGDVVRLDLGTARRTPPSWRRTARGLRPPGRRRGRTGTTSRSARRLVQPVMAWTLS